MAATGGTRAAAHGGDGGRDHGDHDADEQRDDDGAGEHDRGGCREVEPDLAQQVEEADPEQDPHPEPDGRGHRADHERFEHDRPHHLTTGGTHGSQQTELPGPLGHQNREGVEDDEGADHHPDGREAEQRVGEEAEELAHRLADVDRRLRRGLHLELRAERGLEARLQLLGADVGVALHVHRIDGAAGTELTLRGRQVEGGHRDRAQVGGVAVREEADDLVLLGRAAQQHAHMVADVEPVLLGRAGVHRHLIGAIGGVSAGQPERALHPGDAERGRTAAADRVAVTIHELSEGRLHEPLRRPHPGHRSHLRRERLRDAAGGRRGAQGRCRADAQVDTGEGLGEDRLERLLHRVGEHVGRAHEGDPEQDRQRSEGESHLSGEESPDRRLPHGAGRFLLGPIMAARTPRFGAPESWSRSARQGDVKIRPSGLKNRANSCRCTAQQHSQ